jgi:hypothetical protein
MTVSSLEEAVVVGVIVVACVAFAASRIVRAAKGRRPSCCSDGARRRPKRG